MGVPRLFRSLTKILQVNRILHTVHYTNAVIPPCDHMHLDTNSIIHHAAQKVYGYGQYSRPSEQADEKQVFRETCRYIDLLVRMVKPTKSLHIMIDGVCPRAKQNQQMKRRYRTAMETTKTQTFDSNCITPGTPFMDRLSEYMQFYIRLRVQKEWREFDVHFSDSNTPGEGEHKIANWIRDKREYHDDHHCIYGLDADLIVISTTLPPHNIFLLRENIFVNLQRMQFHIFDVTEFRQQLCQALQHNKVTKKQCLQDFSVMSYLIGNDFLPCIPYMNDLMWSLPQMFDMYQKHQLNLYRKNRVNHTDLAILCQHMFEQQITVLPNETLKNYTYPDETLQDCTKYILQNKKWHAFVDVDMWNRKMDEKLCIGSNSKTTREACSRYLAMLNWIATYYFTGVQDWQFCYHFEYAPTLRTLYKTKTKNLFHSSDVSQPSSVETLLLCVTPKESESVIPPHLRQYRIKRDNVEVIREATDVDWAGFTRVQPINMSEVAEIQSKITTRKVEKPRVFRYNSAVSYSYRNMYGYVIPCNVCVN